MSQEIESLLPKKPAFYPAELIRIFAGRRGFSRSRLYGKLAEGKIEFIRQSEGVILVPRDAVLAYFRSLREK